MGGTESTQVTAGIWGFLVLFGLGLACWFLFRSMNAHLRRMRFRERQAEFARESGEGAPFDDGSLPQDDDPIGSSHH